MCYSPQACFHTMAIPLKYSVKYLLNAIPLWHLEIKDNKNMPFSLWEGFTFCELMKKFSLSHLK